MINVIFGIIFPVCSHASAYSIDMIKEPNCFPSTIILIISAGFAEIVPPTKWQQKHQQQQRFSRMVWSRIRPFTFCRCRMMNIPCDALKYLFWQCNYLPWQLNTKLCRIASKCWLTRTHIAQRCLFVWLGKFAFEPGHSLWCQFPAIEKLLLFIFFLTLTFKPHRT